MSEENRQNSFLNPDFALKNILHNKILPVFIKEPAFFIFPKNCNQPGIKSAFKVEWTFSNYERRRKFFG
jgi:hypothetical protein